MIETIIQGCDHIIIATDVHTAFLHADVDQELFAEPPESEEWKESELLKNEVWELNEALYGYREAPKLWQQHVVILLESSKLSSTPDRSELFWKL